MNSGLNGIPSHYSVPNNIVAQGINLSTTWNASAVTQSPLIKGTLFSLGSASDSYLAHLMRSTSPTTAPSTVFMILPSGGIGVNNTTSVAQNFGGVGTFNGTNLRTGMSVGGGGDDILFTQNTTVNLTLANAVGAKLRDQNYYGWNSADAFITRLAAATIHFGLAAAASPVAQTIGVQGSRSGTDSDVGGASFTVRSGIGTGIGTLSSLALQAPIKVASGTGAQTSTTHITLNNTNIILGTAAIATNATDGFLYIPTCAGTPTGVPTTNTGRVALVYDTTNFQFWIYDGAWKQPKTPAGAATVTWQ